LVFFNYISYFTAVTFLENWKRKNATLAHHWDVLDYEEEGERPRPQFAALCPAQEVNPVTGTLEPHFPHKQRLPRILTGIACIFVMVRVEIITVIGILYSMSKRRNI
jgi:anoctamin-7